MKNPLTIKNISLCFYRYFWWGIIQYHGLVYDDSKITVVNDQVFTVHYSEDQVTWLDSVTYRGFTNGAKTVYFKVSAPNHSDLIGSSTVQITPKAITVTADNQSSIHKANLAELTYSSNLLLYAGDTFSGVLATDADILTVGTYNITQGTLSAGANYSMTFVDGTHTITAKATVSVTETPQSGTYNGLAHSFEVTGAKLTGFAVEYFVGGAYTETAPINAGTYTIRISRIEDANYYAFTVEITDGLVVAKATYDMSEITMVDRTIKADGTAQSITISGTLPSGVTVEYSNNGQTAAGVYVVTAAFIGDANNYNVIPTRSATLKLLLSQLRESTGGDVELSSETGFDPDLELDVSLVPNDSTTLEPLSEFGRVVKSYSIHVARDGEIIIFEHPVTLKLLIPEEIADREFRVYHDGIERSYTIEEGYVVISASSLDNFTFVVDQEGSLLWLIVLLSVILLGEIVVSLSIKRKQNKQVMKAYSFSAFFLVAVIPSEQVILSIVLAVLCVVGAFYLFSLLKPKIQTQGDEMVLKGLPLEGEAETMEASTNEEDNSSLEEESSSEEKEQLKGIEEETGLAILVRYRKSFMAKLIQTNDATKNDYSVLKNELLSYKKVKSHISWNFDSIRVGRTNLAKFKVRGNKLYLYLALDPNEYTITKYKVEKVDSKKYADLSCLYKIYNLRRLKYALELIEVIASKYNLVKGEEQNEDYVLPYESPDALLAKGLIKELISKEKYEDWLNRQNKAEVEGKKRSFVLASEVDTILQDQVAASLVTKKSVESVQKKEKAIINIDTISAHYQSGETVDLQSLQTKGLISAKTNYYKVLARGMLDKTLTMEANEFSIQAVKMILLTGGKVIKII